MKKFAALLCVLLFIGSVVFAEDAPAITFGAWGRIVFVPAASTGVDGADSFAYTGPGFARGGRVGVSVHGTSDNIGFDLNIDSNGGAIGAGDFARVWLKFNDMVRIDLGKANIDNLRGKVGPGPWINEGQGEDSIFQRIQPNSGIVVSLTPVPGLFIAYKADVKEGPNGFTDKDGKDIKFMDTLGNVYEGSQLAAGYTLEGIGLARVQYVGSTKAADRYINAAFAYTGMEGVTVDVGAKYFLENDTTANIKARLGATYSKDALSAGLRVGVDAGNSVDLALPLSVNVEYVVAAPISLGLAFVAGDLLAKDNPLLFMGDDPAAKIISPYVKVAYGKGDLVAGAKLFIGEEFAWEIPIGVTYGF